MAVEDGKNFYPKYPTAQNAFNLANGIYMHIPSSPEDLDKVPQKYLTSMSSHYVSAGIGYLANHGFDEYLQHLGTISWWALTQNAITSVTTSNIRRTIEGAPISDDSKAAIMGPETILIATFAEQRSTKVIMENNFAFVKPEFLIKARLNPTEAMSELVSSASQIKDSVNKRWGRDSLDIIKARAEAAQAHFLHHELASRPDLAFSDWVIDILKKYPQGLQSLPRDTSYRGIPDAGILKAREN